MREEHYFVQGIREPQELRRLPATARQVAFRRVACFLREVESAVICMGFDLHSSLGVPVISNQKMNQYLKDLANFAGINESITNVYYSGNKRVTEVVEKWQLVSTHCGRRTFIVNALYLGIPAEVVMKWTGHSDYSSMKPYIEIIDDLKSKEMKKFNEGPKKPTD